MPSMKNDIKVDVVDLHFTYFIKLAYCFFQNNFGARNKIPKYLH